MKLYTDFQAENVQAKIPRVTGLDGSTLLISILVK